jgi:hypothetical protein
MTGGRHDFSPALPALADVVQEDLDCMGNEEGQAEPEGLEDLHLLDGILARRGQDAQCASGERQEDGWRGGQAEGQGDEGGGAGLP